LLREALVRADYDGPRLQRVLRVERNIRDKPSELGIELRRLEDGGPLATLIKLFHIGLGVGHGEAEAAFAPLTLDRLAELGVLALGDADVEPLVAISPVGGVFVVSDRIELQPRHHDYVGPVSPGTVVLAAFTLRRRIGTALDVGAGSGFQALQASRHADRVVATDVNPRALRFTQFNAALNERTNIEVREGSLFEPVEGESFDLIVSNPPYVIAPGNEYAFRDSGLPGDSFVEGLIRTVPAHLREDGVAQVLVEWSLDPKQEWSEPLRRWVDGNGCDSLLFEFSEQEPLDYADLWNSPLRTDPAAHAASVDRWLEHLDRLGILRIGWGMIALRRRSGANWVRTREDTLSADRIEPAARHVERAFAAEDFLAVRDDEALLTERLALADDAVLEVQFTVSEGRRLVREAELALQGGFRLRVKLDEHTLELVSRLDERRPLREVLAGLAGEGADQHAFDVAAAHAVRRLIELGFVVSGEEEPELP
jgi:Methyltransferase small domain